MRLLIIRHAIAARGTPGMSDDERPLTRKGKRRFRQAARGLARLAPRPDALLTSPLLRAVKTAEIAGRAWGRLKPKEEPALGGENVARILAVVAAHPKEATVAVVGHEPQLSALLARLVGSSGTERFVFRKGGAALVDLPGSPAHGGRLLWFVSPRILRGLGRRRRKP